MQFVKPWWESRSVREQVLLAGLCFLAALFLLYQFGAKPLSDYRAAAAVSYEAAATYLNDVETDAAKIIAFQNLAKNDGGRDVQSIRATVSEMAQDLGLTITRLQPVADEGLDVWLDSTDSAAFFSWTIQLHEKHGIGVTRANVQRNDDSTVRAQVTFGGEN